jgi:hypothetical protein
MKTKTGTKADKAAARVKAEIEQGSADLAKAMEVKVEPAKAEKTLTPAQQEAKDLKAKLAAVTAKAKAEAKEAADARKADKAVKAEARKVEMAQKKEQAAALKVEKATREPDMMSQLDEHGNPELVDRNVFCHEIACTYPGCSEVRFVTKSGMLEATMCKPHARKTRRQRRLNRVKDAAKNYKAAIEEAITLGLFPKAFMDKHGLSK